MSEIGDDDSVFDLLPEFRLTPEEQAVIAAARLAASISYPSHVEKYAAVQRLRAAVRALDKVEAGDA